LFARGHGPTSYQGGLTLNGCIGWSFNAPLQQRKFLHREQIGEPGALEGRSLGRRPREEHKSAFDDSVGVNANYATMKTRMKLILGVVPFLVSAAGCAKKQVVADPIVSKQETAAPVEQKPVAEAQSSSSDLDAILRDTVLYFSLDDATLTPESQTKLQRLAEVLKAKSGAKIRIAGHCDERGTVEYNIALGHRRATSTRKYLVDLGVTPAVVDTVSFGSERPAVNGSGEAAWAQNRRAELESQR
jgi:peptidoglycan-associated lipoprotein